MRNPGARFDFAQSGIAALVAEAFKSQPVLAENIRRLLDARGLNQLTLARGSGFQQGTLSKILNGRESPSLNTLDRLADALGVETWQLLVPQVDPARLPALMPRALRDPQTAGRMRALVDAVRIFTEAEAEGKK